MYKVQGTVTKKHLGVLAVARLRLKLEEDVWRDLLHTYGGVRSAKELTLSGFDAVMRRCRELGFTSSARMRREAATDGVITPPQQEKIQKLYEDLGWNKRRQVGFNQRQLGCGWPQDTWEAERLIEALKKMVARGYSERTPQSNPVPSNPDNPR